MSRDTGKRKSRRHRGRNREARFNLTLQAATVYWEGVIRTCEDIRVRMTSMARNYLTLYGGRNPLPVVFPKPRTADPTVPTDNKPWYYVEQT